MTCNWLKTTDCIERDAHYQAGHAVIALQEALEVVRVFIEDDGSSWIEIRYPDLSQTRLARSVRARSDAKSVIRTLLAGPAAHLRYRFGTCGPAYPPPDFDLATPDMLESDAVWRAISLAAKISGDSLSIIHTSWRRVNRLIHGDDIWRAIAAVAEALLINGELAGCEIREIANSAMA